jgi:two-component sensor histidine kinase
MKYGALSDATGTLDITSASEPEQIVLTWLEGGGPPVSPPDGPEGYGSKLIRRTVTSQLGGNIDYDWSNFGLIVTLRIKRTRLSL